MSKKDKKESDDSLLRVDGYMTVNEFVDSLMFGLKDFLAHNWRAYDDDKLHHPEDLFMNASIYIEVGSHIAGTFTVGSAKPVVIDLKKLGKPW